MATFQDIFKEINDTIKTNSRPTAEWISGMFSRSADIKSTERKLNDPKYVEAIRANDEEKGTHNLDNMENLLIVHKIGVKHGLLSVSKSTGLYKKTDKGSKFIQEITNFLHVRDESKAGDSFKQTRAVWQNHTYGALQDWFNDQPEQAQHIINTYREITLKEFYLLAGLLNDQKGKNKYVNRVESLEDSDHESYSALLGLGIITEKNTINVEFLTNFFKTLSSYDDKHLRSFNASISSRVYRSEADKALIRNQLNRSMDSSSPRSSDVAVQAKEYVQGANPAFLQKIKRLSMEKNGRISGADKNSMLLDTIVDASGALTRFGMAVAALVGLKNLDQGEQSELNSRMPMGASDQGSRQQSRSNIRQGRAQGMDNLLHRAKVGESKHLSFKQYLIEHN